MLHQPAILTHYPCADAQVVACSLLSEYARSGRAARGWLEDVVGLPFAGMPRISSMISLIMAADEARVATLIDIAVDGLEATFAEAMEVAAMEDAYEGVDRTEPIAGSVARTVAA